MRELTLLETWLSLQRTDSVPGAPVADELSCPTRHFDQEVLHEDCLDRAGAPRVCWTGRTDLIAICFVRRSVRFRELHCLHIRAAPTISSRAHRNVK